MSDLSKDYCDKVSIIKFINNNQNKKIIAIQGLGFVGAVMSLVCANAIGEEYAVIGVDLPKSDILNKIKLFNTGTFPLEAEDPKINEYYQNALEKGNLYATCDSIAFKYADIVVIDINLDVEKEYLNNELANYNVNINNFKNAIITLGKMCKEDVLLLVETTVPPGTCKNIVKPIIDYEFRERDLSRNLYKLGHSYERVMPGPQYIDSIQSFPRVYSGIDSFSAEAIEIFLKTIIDTTKCSLTRLENTNATEIAKVLENSYRATNIAFVIEWSRFAEEAGVNLYEIIHAIHERPTHKNLMYPGIGVGGYCLTKDPLLASWARSAMFNGSELSMSVSAVRKNDKMPSYAFDYLLTKYGPVENKKVLILGVSYRGDVADTRYSPVETFSILLLNHKADITFHDPYVKKWIEMNIKVNNDFNELLTDIYDVIIICSNHNMYKKDNFIDMLLNIKNKTMIYDTIGLLNDMQIKRLRSKHNILILGRGDL